MCRIPQRCLPERIFLWVRAWDFDDDHRYSYLELPAPMKACLNDFYFFRIIDDILMTLLTHVSPHYFLSVASTSIEA